MRVPRPVVGQGRRGTDALRPHQCDDKQHDDCQNHRASNSTHPLVDLARLWNLDAVRREQRGNR